MSYSSKAKGLAVALFLAPSLVVGLTACPKKETPPVVDAAPPPAPTPVETALTPMEDAGEDSGDSGDSGKKPTGPWVDPKVANIKRCCAALRGAVAGAGASPEAGMLLGAAAQCDAMAAQAGAKGTAPELGFLRQLKTVPPVCRGL